MARNTRVPIHNGSPFGTAMSIRAFRSLEASIIDDERKRRDEHRPEVAKTSKFARRRSMNRSKTNDRS